MNIWPFKKRNPGRELARIKHRNERERIRAVCDDMRRRNGQPPAKWPPIKA